MIPPTRSAFNVHPITGRFRALTGGLRPWQAATCGAVFLVTLIGAVALAFAFRWWNARP
jgi:hypothetical protein